MAQNSKIEWTDATWNFLAGCSKVSDGCKNCYAIKGANRMASNPNEKIRAKYAPTISNERGFPNWSGEITFTEDTLLVPLKTKKPTKFFVNSMSDLFHEKVANEWLDKAFAVMALCPQHIFQVLTKRPERMVEYFRTITDLDGVPLTHFRPRIANINHQIDMYLHRNGRGTERLDYVRSNFPLPNCWLGVSVEDQKTADKRIPLLLQTPAAIRWLSIEPLLGPVDLWDGLRRMKCAECGVEDIVPAGDSQRFEFCADEDLGELPGIDWVVAGGESGPDARPMHPDWPRQIRDQCTAANVPFFFKQWGEWLPGERTAESGTGYRRCDTGEAYTSPLHSRAERRNFGTHADPNSGRLITRKIGKTKAGRTLDGRTWDEYPEVSR